MPKDERSPNLLSTADVAEIAGVSVATINRWAAAGRIAPFLRGPGRTGARLYDRAEVEALAKVKADR